MGGGSRGRKKPKLRDLSRDIPTKDELIAINRALGEAHPTAAGILGAVVVEHDLETLLRDRLAKDNDELWAELTDDNGPLGTFFRKIKISRALKIIDDPTQQNLHIVRNIRNAFAHSKKLIDFDHPLIVAELRSLEIPRYNKRRHKDCKNLYYGSKESYLSLCHFISMHLVRKHIKNTSTSNKRRLQKTGSPFANLLMQNYLQRSTKSSPLSSLDDQNDDPNPAIPGGLLGGILHLVPKKPDNSDK